MTELLSLSLSGSKTVYHPVDGLVGGEGLSEGSREERHFWMLGSPW